MDWFYAKDGQQQGPVSESDLGQLVTPDTLVWHAGMTEWQPYRSVAAATEIPLRNCNACGKSFPPAELAMFGESAVCAACQPAYVQRLRQGMTTTAPAIFRYAGFWIRVLAVIIDSIILQVLQYAVFIPLGLTTFTGSRDLQSAAAIMSIMILVVLNLVYYVVFWSQFGATPGKMALGLKVVRADGGPVSVGQSIGRYFAEILSGITLGIGYMMAGWDSEKRALHDRICETRVIRTR
jgi:uncharacterized RDD family membrane protein YckC